MIEPMSCLCGRDVCGDYAIASRREWLVTNGIGGFASGTLSDALTRRYHGLLFAAVHQPLDRRLLLAKLEADVHYADMQVQLAANQWHDGEISPTGYRFVESFELRGSIPVWRFRIADAVLKRSIWMEPHANVTFVRYELIEGSAPLSLSLRALAGDRKYHELTHSHDTAISTKKTQFGADFTFNDGMVLSLDSDTGTLTEATVWYDGFALQREAERGLDSEENLLHIATIAATLRSGDSLTVRAACNDSTVPIAGAFDRRVAADAALLQKAARTAIDPFGARLTLAADQFVVARGDGTTVIAGYPWFGDWGRDTMIVLPVLLDLGRTAEAIGIIKTFAAYLSDGMLPNRFPDAGETPEYNTADATLWYVDAIGSVFDATSDVAFAREMLAVIDEIVTWHRRGTRYAIHVDPDDGLLYAGVAGVQVTWMDAKVGDDVITPRIGKPVELSALWINALCVAERLASACELDATTYKAAAERATASMQRFWNSETTYCYDVLDGPSGNDASIRPNAVIAAGVSFPIFSNQRVAAIVDLASRALLTDRGLRTLAPSDAGFRGTYGGSQRERDAAYHQGTVWPCLILPYVRAALRAGKSREALRQLVDGFSRDLGAYGIGSIAEIAEGDAPFRYDGCIAQAWSVSSLIQARRLCTP